MREKLKDLARQAGVVLLIVGLIVPGVGYALTDAHVGYAAPAYDDDDSEDKDEDEDATDTSRSMRDDRQMSGQVLEINSLKDPPEITIANMDGEVLVRLLTTDLIPKNGVRLGDHVTIFGEKISEVEFEAQELSVDGHLGDEMDESDD